MISVYFNGRLGNQIFQYVSLRYVSSKNRSNFWAPSNHSESVDFYSTMSSRFGRCFELPTDTNPHYWIGNNIFQIDFGVYDNDINMISDTEELDSISESSLMVGFYQTDKYIQNIRDDVKSWLVLRPELKDKSKNILNKYPTSEYCYIHFRGGDYKQIDKYYLPIQYYIDSAKKISDINKDIKYVVITDDCEEAKKFFPNYDVISNSMEIDFYLLYSSKYTIIPNSSFSWWASWLNDDNIITIAPERWFNYNKGEGDFDPPYVKSSRFTYIDKKQEKI